MIHFSNPWAFLLLLAIPVLIVIYILRNKYKEQTAPSTYIWEVSQKFLKKRNPFRSVEHLLALIIELLTIASLAIALAGPSFTLKGQAEKLVFVLDDTASMNITHDGKTRFERAKDGIKDKVKDAKEGSEYTLILAEESDDADYRLVCGGSDHPITDKDQFNMFLDSLKPSYSSVELAPAIGEAQKVIADGHGTLCYLATDKKINQDQLSNIDLIDVSDDEVNYAIQSLTYNLNSDDVLSINGSLYSYNEDKDLTVDIYVNDEYVGTTLCQAKNGIEYVLSMPDVPYNKENKKISSVKAEITNKDALAADNTYIVYDNETAVRTKILLVSDEPLYFRSAFNALNRLGLNVTLTIYNTRNYVPEEGYDVYVFDCYNPDELPASGAIWLIGTNETIGNSGFRAQGKYTIPDGGDLSYTENDSLLYAQLTQGLVKRDILISKYNRYSLLDSFTTILSYNNMPMVFVGRNDLGKREVVFSFDLHDSDLPVTGYDFLYLLRNLVNYSHPSLLNKYAFNANDTIALNIPDDSRLEITSPDGKKEPISSLGAEVVSYHLDSVGTYSLALTDSGSSDKTVKVFSAFPKEEANPTAVDTTVYSIVMNDNTVKADGIFDSLLPVIIVAAVLFSADWILYAHEQY